MSPRRPRAWPLAALVVALAGCWPCQEETVVLAPWGGSESNYFRCYHGATAQATERPNGTVLVRCVCRGGR